VLVADSESDALAGGLDRCQPTQPTRDALIGANWTPDVQRHWNPLEKRLALRDADDERRNFVGLGIRDREGPQSKFFPYAQPLEKFCGGRHLFKEIRRPVPTIWSRY